ncbi:unnamed protein product, partial [Prorocentrum cordatum]
EEEEEREKEEEEEEEEEGRREGGRSGLLAARPVAARVGRGPGLGGRPRRTPRRRDSTSLHCFALPQLWIAATREVVAGSSAPVAWWSSERNGARHAPLTGKATW